MGKRMNGTETHTRWVKNSLKCYKKIMRAHARNRYIVGANISSRKTKITSSDATFHSLKQAYNHIWQERLEHRRQKPNVCQELLKPRQWKPLEDPCVDVVVNSAYLRQHVVLLHRPNKLWSLLPSCGCFVVQYSHVYLHLFPHLGNLPHTLSYCPKLSLT